MNDRLKFRQVIVDEKGKFKEFHYWGYIYEKYPNYFVTPVGYGSGGRDSYYPTGSKDKAGTLIYEGDIIRVNDCINLISWEGTYLAGFQYVRGKINEDMEVIGNKFENPELLEEK
jgi:hypothetical protein